MGASEGREVARKYFELREEAAGGGTLEEEDECVTFKFADV